MLKNKINISVKKIGEKYKAKIDAEASVLLLWESGVGGDVRSPTLKG